MINWQHTLEGAVTKGISSDIPFYHNDNKVIYLGYVQTPTLSITENYSPWKPLDNISQKSKFRLDRYKWNNTSPTRWCIKWQVWHESYSVMHSRYEWYSCVWSSKLISLCSYPGDNTERRIEYTSVERRVDCLVWQLRACLMESPGGIWWSPRPKNHWYVFPTPLKITFGIFTVYLITENTSLHCGANGSNHEWVAVLNWFSLV